MKEKKLYTLNLKTKKILSKREEKEYIKKVKEGDKKAEEILIEHNLKLVIHVVNKYFSNANLEKEDLFQVGCMGLLRAIKRFDPSLKFTLSTYAVPSIWGEIQRYVNVNNSMLKVPDKIKKLLVKIIKLKNDDNIDNDSLSISKMAEILNVDEQDVILALYSNQNIRSLSEPIKINAENEGKLEDLIPSTEPSTEELLMEKEVKIVLYSLIKKLDEREQIIIRYSYGLNCKEKNQKEIAQMLNISQTRVSDIKKRIISDLHYYLTNQKDILELITNP